MATAFRIEMDNLQEVPDTTSTATGLGTVVFDSAAVTATYDITVTGLDFGPLLGLAPQTADPNDDVGGIHVHNAARNANGPIVFGQFGPAQDNDDLAIGINPDDTTTFSGIWETTDPPNGANPGIAGFAAALGAATLGADVPLYWNIHTTQFPGGAIRGQWVCIATDNSETVTGTDGDDILPGLGGNDTIDGGLGDDEMDGGTGSDVLKGGLSSDALEGGANGDFADYRDKTTAVVVTLNAGTNATVTVGGVAEDTVRNIENVYGGIANDILTGDGFGNYLFGNSGTDLLKGGGGADTLDGGVGGDFADYRDKVNSVVVTLATDAIVTVGGVAEDTVRNIENVYGGTAGDTLTGDGFGNFLFGHSGNDLLKGGGGADELDGSTGVDRADYSDKAVAVVVTLNGATNAIVTVGGVAEDTIRNIENVRGGSANDTLTGDGLANLLDGGAGTDVLKGGLGADTLDGGDNGDFADYRDKTTAVVVTLNGGANATVTVGGVAEDTIRNIENVYGGSAGDTLTGDGFGNYLFGNSGNDTLKGGGGADTLDGYDGVDTADYRDKASSVVVTLNGATNATVTVGGVAEDTIRNIENVTGGTAGDTLTGDGLRNLLSGDAGNDLLRGGGNDDVLSGNLGADTLDGQAGIDTADYSDKATAVVVTLNGATNTTVTVGGVAEDTIRNIENVTGGTAGDTLTGDGLANSLYGNSGDDLLSGSVGTDTLRGGVGADTLDGGADVDLADYRDKTTSVAVTLNGASNATVTVGGVAEDTIRNIENVHGGTAGDILAGDTFANSLFGDAGNDTLKGGGGADFLDGAAGLDTADYSDKTAPVVVTLFSQVNVTVTVGGVAEDTIRSIEGVIGGSAGDTLTGDGFDNLISGGGGNDILGGGSSGADTFVFNTALDVATNVDHITEFSIFNDIIQLDNAVFSALSVTGTLDADAFHAAAGATAAADLEDRIVYNTTTGALYYDADGNQAGGVAAVQFAVLDNIANNAALTNADFIVV